MCATRRDVMLSSWPDRTIHVTGASIMDLFDTATHLRVNSRHIQQIAADVDRTRPISASASRVNPTGGMRSHHVIWMRRAVGSLFIQIGERLIGCQPAVMADTAPSA
jgi:hypothetical protein